MAATPDERFGRIVTQARHERGLHQTDVAEAIGKSTATVSLIERGIRGPHRLRGSETVAWLRAVGFTPQQIIELGREFDLCLTVGLLEEAGLLAPSNN